MLLNAKLNETAQKILWVEAVNACNHIRNSMDTTGITKSPFETLTGRNRRSLFHYQSLDVSPASLKGTKLRRE